MGEIEFKGVGQEWIHVENGRNGTGVFDNEKYSLNYNVLEGETDIARPLEASGPDRIQQAVRYHREFGVKLFYAWLVSAVPT